MHAFAARILFIYGLSGSFIDWLGHGISTNYRKSPRIRCNYKTDVSEVIQLKLEGKQLSKIAVSHAEK